MLTRIISPSLTVVLYDSIEEFPVNIELEARQYATIQSGLANNEQELAEKKERIELLVQYDKKAEADQERANYRLAEKLIAEQYNPQELEWCCYIHSINGETVSGHSEDALRTRLESLKSRGLESSFISESLGFVKSQMSDEVMRYYPNRVAKGRQMNNLTRYKAYGLALADYYESPNEETRLTLDKATISLLATQEILSFRNDQTNVLDQMKKAQFRAYTILVECGVVAPESLTLFAYYGWMEVLEKRYEDQKQSLTPHASKRQ